MNDFQRLAAMFALQCVENSKLQDKVAELEAKLKKKEGKVKVDGI